MIVTLTANPSIDETIALGGQLVRGEVHVAAAVSSQSGGKGVNICRAAHAAGVPTIAVLPASPAHRYVTELEAAGIHLGIAPTSREVRSNITVSEPDGTTTKLNSPGEDMPEHVLARLGELLTEAAEGAEWVVLAGSLPPGVAPSWYADLVAGLKAVSARVAVDTSGAALKGVTEGIVLPDLLKPNGHELASIVGGSGDEFEADPIRAAKAAAGLVKRGVASVLVTLGGRGAVLATKEGQWLASPPPINVVSTVGAGDSSLFGYLWGDLQGLDPAHRLALAVAYGSAAAALPGTGLPLPYQADPMAVEVSELNLTH